MSAGVAMLRANVTTGGYHNMKRRRIRALPPVWAAAMVAVGVVLAPPVHADTGWVAAASSPSHEQLDFAYGPDQATAEYRALARCTQLQRAGDCILLASGPDCVAVAWDVDEPVNDAHGVSGGGPEVVLHAAMAIAGPHANDPDVRCSWYPHD